MSTMFQYPYRPLDWAATPRDLSEDVANVPHMGVYTAETTQRFVPGTRHITWDGRVFKYSLSAGTIGAGLLGFFGGGVTAEGIAYTTVSGGKVAGDEQVSVASQSFAEDVLAGGMMLLYGSDNTYNQNRMIVGNNYCSTSTLTLELEAPLSVAITDASTGIEVQPNPYLYITVNETYGSCSGLAATRATTGNYYWQQTWGMCAVTAGHTISGASLDRQLVTGYGAGAVYKHDATHATTDQCQHAGFILDADATTVPFVMLQISI